MKTTKKKKLTFYTYPNSSSCRQVRMWLTKHQLEFEERHLFRKPPTEIELLAISKITKNGLPDLVATRSSSFKELGVRACDLSFSEYLQLIGKDPFLLKLPIVTDGEHAVVGNRQSALRAYFL